MKSLRSDTLTLRVTGVRITVFSSAIVIDVIVRCHTAGALLSQTAENNCPYHRVVGFHPFRPVQNHTWPLSSGEPELAAVVMAATEGMGLQSILNDF